jgi:hypothetical protein
MPPGEGAPPVVLDVVVVFARCVDGTCRTPPAPPPSADLTDKCTRHVHTTQWPSWPIAAMSPGCISTRCANLTPFLAPLCPPLPPSTVAPVSPPMPPVPSVPPPVPPPLPLSVPTALSVASTLLSVTDSWMHKNCRCADCMISATPSARMGFADRRRRKELSDSGFQLFGCSHTASSSYLRGGGGGKEEGGKREGGGGKVSMGKKRRSPRAVGAGGGGNRDDAIT